MPSKRLRAIIAVFILSLICMPGSSMAFQHQQSSQGAYIQQRSFTYQSQLAHQGSLFLPSTSKNVMMSSQENLHFSEQPKIYDFGNERVLIYPRVQEGLVFEDSFKAVYRKAGFPDRVFMKGVASVSTRDARLSYEDAWHLIQERANFDYGQDIDLNHELTNAVSYRLNPASQEFHLTYSFVFHSAAMNSVMRAKVDAITGEVVEFRKNRYEHQDVELQSTLFDLHPLSDSTLRPFRGLTVTEILEVDENGEVEERDPFTTASDSRGNLDLPEDVERFMLTLENDLLAVGAAGGSWSVLPVEAESVEFTSEALVASQGDLSSHFTMSSMVPFFFLQNEHENILTLIAEDVLKNKLPVATDYSDMWGNGCNAYFSPGWGSWDPPHLVFFDKKDDKCRKAGQFSTIVLHEFGHYIDHLYSGIEDSASSEGFGDILSLLAMREPILAEHFLTNTPNHYIRDLRIDRLLPIHQGEVHFEGQIVGSAFWNLVQVWNSAFSEDWVYEKLQGLFYKSLSMISNMRDIAGSMITILQETPESQELNHLQCSINQIFSEHGLAVRDDGCVQNSPKITINIHEENFALDSKKRGYLEAGSKISVSLSADLAGLLDVVDGYATATVWMDDEMLSKETVKLTLEPGKDEYKDLFFVELPLQVSPSHQYHLRVSFTDKAKYLVWDKYVLNIDRVKRETIASDVTVDKEVTEKVSVKVPFALSNGGFVDGAVRVKFNLSSESGGGEAIVFLESADGKQEEATVFPPKFEGINDKWVSIPYRFQGDSAANEMFVTVLNYGSAKFKIDNVSIEVDVFDPVKTSL